MPVYYVTTLWTILVKTLVYFFASVFILNVTPFSIVQIKGNEQYSEMERMCSKAVVAYFEAVYQNLLAGTQ